MKRKLIFILIFISTFIFSTYFLSTASAEDMDDFITSDHSDEDSNTSATDSNTEQAKNIYELIYEGVKNHADSVTFPTSDCKFIDDIFSKFTSEHSEYMNYVTCDILNPDDSNQTTSLNLYYQYTKDDQDEYDRKLDEILNSIITPDMTVLQKELAVHDYIVLNCKYDHSKKIPDISYTAYGAIMKKTAVNDGYTKAMNCLLNRAGIKSISMNSLNMGHSWNIITIDGKTYNTDATWDDTDDGTNIYYDNFNQDDNTFLRTHHWTAEESHPDCTSTDYSCFQNVHAYFRLGNDIYYNTGLYQPLYKSDMKNGVDLDTSLFVSDNMDYSAYFNGWIYCSKSKNLSDLYRVNISDPSKEEIVKANVNPSAISVLQGVIHYYNGTLHLKDQVRIPNYNKLDFNGDNNVDVADLAQLAHHYNKCTSSLYCQSTEDLNKDGVIDIYDIVKLSINIE